MSWGAYLETPPSFFGNSPSPCIENSSVTSLIETQPQLEEETPHGFVIPKKPEQHQNDSENPELETRILIIKNIGSFVNNENINELVKQREKIRNLESLSDNSLVIEFYDMRDSQYYRSFLPQVKFQNQNLIVSYGPARKTTDDGKPANNGTLVLFYLPPTLSNVQLGNIFSKYGEIRQIRKTPNKNFQRFIEFWDVRSAEKAKNSLNGTLFSGSRVFIDFSVPGGQRRKAQQESNI